MPFGLVYSGAAFCRMMRDLLRRLHDTDNFVDESIVHTGSWEKHLVALHELLERLRTATLTDRPKKCKPGRLAQSRESLFPLASAARSLQGH